MIKFTIKAQEYYCTQQLALQYSQRKLGGAFIISFNPTARYHGPGFSQVEIDIINDLESVSKKITTNAQYRV